MNNLNAGANFLFKDLNRLNAGAKFLFKDLNNSNAGAKGFPPYFRFVANVDFYDPNQSTSAVEENAKI